MSNPGDEKDFHDLGKGVKVRKSWYDANIKGTEDEALWEAESKFNYSSCPVWPLDLRPIENKFEGAIVDLEEEYGYARWLWIPGMSNEDLEQWWKGQESLDQFHLSATNLPGFVVPCGDADWPDDGTVQSKIDNLRSDRPVYLGVNTHELFAFKDCSKCGCEHLCSHKGNAFSKAQKEAKDLVLPYVDPSLPENKGVTHKVWKGHFHMDEDSCLLTPDGRRIIHKGMKPAIDRIEEELEKQRKEELWADDRRRSRDGDD